MILGQGVEKAPITGNNRNSFQEPLPEIAVVNTNIVKNGTGYLRGHLWSGQAISQHYGDEGEQFQSGFFEDSMPPNPKHIAKLDLNSEHPFVTMNDDNHFGDKRRFTPIDGGTIYNDPYTICNLTGYGIVTHDFNYGGGSLSNQYGVVANLNYLGFNDWRVMPINVLNSIVNRGNGVSPRDGLNYAPFNLRSNYYIGTSTLVSTFNEAFIYHLIFDITPHSNVASNRNVMIYRKHF